MAAETTNYKLKKPSQEDFYNIDDQNENMNIIDRELKNVADVGSGILEQIGSHWWKRRVDEVGTESIVVSEVKSSVDHGSNDNLNYTVAMVYYSDSYTVADGIFTLVNPSSVQWVGSNKSEVVTKLTGKYYIISKNNGTVMYYGGGGSDAFAVDYVIGGIYFYHQIKNTTKYTIETKVYENVGEYEYIHSTDRNAYPDNGKDGSFSYTYLGVPFENARESTKFICGTYVGAGTSGVNNPNTITVDGIPQVVIVSTAGGVNGAGFSEGSGVFAIRGMTSVYQSLSWNWGENSVSWYFTSGNSGISTQFNEQGKTYYYAVIYI